MTSDPRNERVPDPRDALIAELSALLVAERARANQAETEIGRLREIVNGQKAKVREVAQLIRRTKAAEHRADWLDRRTRAAEVRADTLEAECAAHGDEDAAFYNELAGRHHLAVDAIERIKALCDERILTTSLTPQDVGKRQFAKHILVLVGAVLAGTNPETTTEDGQ